MGWLASKFGPQAAKVLAFLAVAAVVIGLMVVAQCTTRRNAQTDVKVSKDQAGGALDSGRDAVTTVGNVSAGEQVTDQVTRENEDAIRNAEGADAPVAAPVRDAGLSSLCRRAAYRGDPKCVQQPAAK